MKDCVTNSMTGKTFELLGASICLVFQSQAPEGRVRVYLSYRETGFCVDNLLVLIHVAPYWSESESNLLMQIHILRSCRERVVY